MRNHFIRKLIWMLILCMGLSSCVPPAYAAKKKKGTAASLESAADQSQEGETETPETTGAAPDLSELEFPEGDGPGGSEGESTKGEEPETTKEPETKAPVMKKVINGIPSPEFAGIDWADNEHISLRWTSVEGADGYRVYRSKKKASGYKTVVTLKGVNSLRTLLTSGKNTRYYYAVRAYKVVDGKKKFGGVSDPVKNVKYANSRLGELFPTGVPKTSKEMKKYLVAIKAPMWQENGKLVYKTLYIHQALADAVLACFEDMVAMKFPVRKADTGSYCWRTMSTTDLMSHHSYGCVVDLNWKSNPMVSLAKVATCKYKPGEDKYSITQEVLDIWKSRGFYWGGDWTEKKDFMHLTYTNN